MKGKKLTLADLNKMKRMGDPISWITAYDLPFSWSAEQAGIDMILVGDSGGMVQLGYETTNPVTIDEMLMLTKAVRRGAPNTFIVGDMPQGSYEVSDEEAVRNAIRFVKETGCDAIKLEGGQRVASRVKAIVDAGVVVIGHLGLTPQTAANFGGYSVQGKTRDSFEALVQDMLAIRKAGVSAVLLEALPALPAAQIARQMDIPVLGIGAGNQVDGQLVIVHDLMGFYQPFRPWFAKCYIPEVVDSFQGYLHQVSDLKHAGRKERSDGLLVLAKMAIERYIDEVKNASFPNEEYSYKITNEQLAALRESPFWDASLEKEGTHEESIGLHR